MKKINISYEQSKKLSDELARLVFELKEFACAECIYFAPYKDLGDIKGGVIDITFVVDDTIYNNKFEKEKLLKLVEQYNLLHQNQESVNKYGVKFNLKVDSSDQYSIMAMHSYEVRREIFLFNSIILFDKSGEYAKIKEQAIEFSKNPNTYIKYYTNRAEFIPDQSLMVLLYSSLEKEKAKRDTRVGKKFTKSKIFIKGAE